MESLVPREQLLVALGAAIGSNCTPCVEKILPKAEAAGLEAWELRLAIHAADFVRKKPAAKVLAVAKAIVEREDAPKEEPCPLDRAEDQPLPENETTTGSRSGCCV